MNERLLNRARRIDRMATVVITTGGALVIFAVVLILVLIAKEALPLFGAAHAEPMGAMEAVDDREAAPLAVGVGEYLKNGFVLGPDGAFRFFALAGEQDRGSIPAQVPEGAGRLMSAFATGTGEYALLWDSGAVTVERVDLKPVFDEAGERRLVPKVESLTQFAAAAGAARVQVRTAVSAEGGVTLAAVREDGSLDVRRETREEDFLGNETVEQAVIDVELPDGETALDVAITDDGSRVVVATPSGRLLSWRVTPTGKATLSDNVLVSKDNRPLTALAFVLGGESLAVGDDSGSYSVYSYVPIAEGRGERELRRIRELESVDSPLTRIVASRRHKSLIGITGTGQVVIDHVTTGLRMATLHPDSGGGITQAGVWSRRGDGIATLDDRGTFGVIRIDNPHPEVSFGTMFQKVWYEGYPEPDYVWQSSSASDDFEPKMSLMPLVFGSIKGTVYAMLFAVPLALLGALYTNQFTRPGIRSVVKPAIEVMAAIPSVIIGFLAALWLAPIFEDQLGAVFLSILLLPLSVILAVLIWQVLRRIKVLQVVEAGWEFVAIVPVLLLALWLTSQLAGWMEASLFGGDLKKWLYSEAGLRYDPRNCVVIAFALGFAVIPIIFTIADDAFSNVPRSLTAASLALGASRWQTVWRVVLPSASPGIFAGIVIGLGRAVGETMIVLMATGNTPIMDWSVFNGMRTLSANIAVEIPEAPHGGSLYRVLFLSAMVLFLITFALNTVAEVVRQRLRAKYSQFQ